MASIGGSDLFEEDEIVLRSSASIARSAMLRAGLVFGGLVMLLTAVLVPAAQQAGRNIASAPSLDRMVTGSIDSAGGGTQSYVLRGGILQSPNAAACRIAASQNLPGGC